MIFEKSHGPCKINPKLLISTPSEKNVTPLGSSCFSFFFSLQNLSNFRFRLNIHFRFQPEVKMWSVEL